MVALAMFFSALPPGEVLEDVVALVPLLVVLALIGVVPLVLLLLLPVLLVPIAPLLIIVLHHGCTCHVFFRTPNSSTRRCSRTSTTSSTLTKRSSSTSTTSTTTTHTTFISVNTSKSSTNSTSTTNSIAPWLHLRFFFSHSHPAMVLICTTTGPCLPSYKFIFSYLHHFIQPKS